jgi:enterochelin esterase-like enzyme
MSNTRKINILGESAGTVDIIDKIALKDGKIIDGAYQNTALAENEKGVVKRYVYKDETIKPVSHDDKLSPDEKIIDIYFPAGYDPNAKQIYGLHVFLDGDLHLALDPFGQSMGTQHVLDNLIAAGKMEPGVKFAMIL